MRAPVLAWIAGACALLTAVLVGLAAWVTTVEPRHTVRIEVAEGTPFGISQATVDAVLAQRPVRSWQPMTLRVTDEHLTFEETFRGEGLPEGVDVLLSTRTERLGAQRPDLDASERPERDAAGVGIRPGLGLDEDHADRHDLKRMYLAGLGAGQGPTAVVNVARAMGEASYAGPARVPALHLGLALPALAGALVATALWARARRRQADVRRALDRGRASLARVLLEVEALEVSVAGVAPHALPTGHSQRRAELRRSLQHEARRERDLTDAVERLTARDAIRGTASDDDGGGRPGGRGRGGRRRGGRSRGTRPASSWRDLGQRVAAFEDSTRGLEDAVEQLIDSADVLAATPRRTRVVDRVLAPVAVEMLALTGLLREAPEGAVDPRIRRALDEAYDDLLAVAQHERLDRDAARRWRDAEKSLAGHAREVTAQLERFPLGADAGRVAAAPEDDSLAALRAGLGLSARPAGDLLTHLARARRTAVALLGPLTDEHRGAPSSSGEGAPGASRRADRSDGLASAPHLRRAAWALVTVLAVLVSVPFAQRAADAALPPDPYRLQGSEALRDVVVDGPEVGIDVARIADHVDGTFPRELDVVVAVRAAEAYLAPRATRSDAEDGKGPWSELGVDLDPTVTAQGLRRIVAESAELVDPATGELRPDAVVVPVFVFEDGRRVMGRAPLNTVDTFRPWTVEGMLLTSLPHAEGAALAGEIGAAVVRAGEAMQLADREGGAAAPDVEPGLLTAVLTAGFAAVLLTLALALESLATTAAGLRGLGSLTSSGRRLRALTRRLEALMLGLDVSRLDAVAVLGRGPAASAQETGQRLYERELVAAWREAKALAGTSVVERLRGGMGDRLDGLEATAAALEHREADVADRAAEVLERARRHPA
ncbi:hypothetical protein [Micrococcus endophyticus]|uniref:hypothetical protein n=1 Tax=Micrococcus endophyticus TaxID=455343 RepID=UPI002006C112|nr:hypothetical protein [Micrococcus endophyticus]MCK6091582.1 hypothetical protein [Micrococcus endophyticus]